MKRFVRVQRWVFSSNERMKPPTCQNLIESFHHRRRVAKRRSPLENVGRGEEGGGETPPLPVHPPLSTACFCRSLLFPLKCYPTVLLSRCRPFVSFGCSSFGRAARACALGCYQPPSHLSPGFSLSLRHAGLLREWYCIFLEVGRCGGSDGAEERWPDTRSRTMLCGKSSFYLLVAPDLSSVIG